MQKLRGKIYHIFVLCLVYLFSVATTLFITSGATIRFEGGCLPMISFPKMTRASIAPVSSGVASINTETLYPRLLKHLVRVNNLVHGGSGSGVILWSGLDKGARGHTFILTNKHVLAPGQPGTVEVFEYLNFRDVESVRAFPVFAVTCSTTADLALLEIITNDTLPNAATFISSEDYESMALYTNVNIVGCGLGNAPFISTGPVIGFEKDSLLVNGFSVWGCSGGGVFDDSGRLVAISCKIGMAQVAGQDYAVTNLSSSIPINIICEWLLSTPYKFIVNSELGSIDNVYRTPKLY